MATTKVSLLLESGVAQCIHDEGKVKQVDSVSEDEMILDIGPDTARSLAASLARAGTIVWNGPVGAFEKEPFAKGTRVIAEAIASSKAYSIAGGGDTVAAIN